MNAKLQSFMVISRDSTKLGQYDVILLQDDTMSLPEQMVFIN